MTEPVIEFFWDPVSPYTYLASTRIEALAVRVGAVLRWRPFLLGKVLEATGNRPNIDVPAKGRHMLADLARWARHYGVPLVAPPTFPISTVTALRAGLAAEQAGRGPAFATAVMRAYWGEGRDISQAQTLLAVAAAAGLDGAALLAQTQEPAIKDALRSNTDEAVRRGAFGAPTFFVGEQMFWGNDRLGILEECLAGDLSA